MQKKTFSNFFKGRKTTRSSSQRRRAFRKLLSETLETRQLMAGDIATGYGTFQYAEELASDFGGMVADINNDGKLDVIGDTVHLRTANGWQTYANGPGVGKLVDIDGDNDLDVVRDQYWVENLGGGTSWAEHVVDNINPSSIVYVSSDAADFDGDGDMDIVVALKDWVYWHENVNGDGSEWEGHEVYRSGVFDFVETAVGDMDNDGDMDIVISARNWFISWAENRGGGSFRSNYYNEIGIVGDINEEARTAWSIDVGDFDQDGRADLFAVGVDSTDGPVSWFTPNDEPTERFRRTVVDRLDNADSETLAVDIDNDGQLELLVTSKFNFRTGSDQLHVYERSGFTFTETVLSNDYIGHLIDSGDLDGDGDIDLVGEDFVFWNSGGDFHVETTDVSPISIASDSRSAVLKIEATHNGQDGDGNIFLTSFAFMIDDGTGEVGSQPLNGSTVSALFDRWRIYVGGGATFTGSEDLIVSVSPSSQSGVVQVDLTTATELSRRLRPGETRSYWLEVDMTSTAHEYGDFRITNLTDQGILAGKDAGAVDFTGNVDAIKDYTPNVGASMLSASNIAFSLNTVTTNDGIVPPLTTTDVLRIDATHAGLVEGEIASLAFRFDEDGRPLSTHEVNGLIERLSIVGEDQNPIVTVDDLSVDNSGHLRIELPDGDSRLRFHNETRSYFVVVETAADSINQGGRMFRITHLTDESNAEDERSIVEIASNDSRATLVSTPDQSATVIAGTEIDVAVTSSLSTPVTGQQVTYTVTVVNQHDSTDASAIPVQGRIPANMLDVVLVDLQVTGGATSSRTIGESLSGNWTDTLDLPNQSSVTYTLLGTLADLGKENRSMESEHLIGSLTVSLPVEFYDVNSDDNQSLRADLLRLSSTGTGSFVDSGIDLANLDGSGAERINEVALGDIDGDGDIDAIITRGATGAPGYATALLNDGTGSYTESGQDFGYSVFTGAALADFDGDGDLDLYLATSTGIAGATNDTDRVYLNDGNGGFTQSFQSFSYITDTVSVGDTNRDGLVDIVISGPNNSRTLRNFGNGIFVPSSRLGVLDNLTQIQFADLDSDGDLDVVGYGDELNFYLNNGNGFYQAGILLSSFATDFELGDVDNDGDVDILLTAGSAYDSFNEERNLSTLLVLRNDGNASFGVERVGNSSSYQQIELGDFDNDGDLDAFVIDEFYSGTYASGTVSGNGALIPETLIGRLLSNDGSGQFTDSCQTLDYQVQLSEELSYSPTDLSLTAADVNGDSSLDIVTGDYHAAKIWFSNVAPELSVDELSIMVAQGDPAANSGSVSDSAYDSYALAASIGTITDNGDGTWSWSLTETSTLGTTTVTVSATDSAGAVTESTFELLVRATPTISANDLTVEVNEGSTATNSGVVSHVDMAATVILAASVGTVVDNGNGTWDWSFDTNDGPDESQVVTITALDQYGLSSAVSFNLVVNNVAPTLSANQATVTVDEGQTATGSGVFGDVGLDTVGLTASVGTVTTNSNGTWAWTFDTNDGPDQSQTVTITATDSDGAVSTASFALVVNNVAPTVSAIQTTVTVDEGQTATGSGVFGDVGLDTVGLTASVGTVTTNSNGTWAWTFDTNDGPDQSQTVTITATDSDGAVSTASFALVVNNVAPTVSTNQTTVTVDEGQTATGSGVFGDVGLDTVGLTASVGTVTTNSNGTWAWTFDTNDGPDQSQTVTITATDSDGAVSTASFALVVNNVAPTVSANQSLVTVDEGQTATGTGNFGDVGQDTVTLTATVGAVTDNGDGTWSWSFLTSEGFEDSQTVTITATDIDGALSTVSFDLVVFDLPVAIDVAEKSQTVTDLTTLLNGGASFDFRMFGEAPSGEVGPDQTMVAGQSILSPDGAARLVMQGDGNLVVYMNGVATWASNTHLGSNLKITTMEADGNLVIRNATGNVAYQTGSGGNTGAFARLRVNNDGVPEIVRVDGELLWQGTYGGFRGQGMTFSPAAMRPEFALGADTDLFEIVNGNELQFIAAPDFEKPTDADGDGVYEVSVLADDGNGTVIPKTLLVTVTDVVEIPNVEAVVIDDNSGQRSMIRSLSVTFDSEVTIESGAFSIANATTGITFMVVDADVATSVVNGKTIAVLTFSNSSPDIIGESLADGRYSLTIDKSKVHVGVDTMADDHIDQFFRLFGDSNGDGFINALDFFKFRSTYGTASTDPNFDDDFDVNGDGVINALDFFAFRNRYGKGI